MPKKPAAELHLIPAQMGVLENLARYRFLTVSQLLRLGIMSDRANLNKQIKLLRENEPPLLESANYGVYPPFGKLESVHCLTVRGREVIADALRVQVDSLPQGATGVNYHKDYFHRKHTIDFQIAMEQWAYQQGYEVLLFETYYDRVAGKRGGERAKTKLDLGDDRYLIADAIFKLKTPEKQHLYCVEIYNGKDLGRTMRQLRQHAEAIHLGAASIAYNHEHGNRVLCVFEDQGLLDSVRENLHTEPYFSELQDHFLLKPLSEIQKDERFETWVTPEGRPGRITGN